MTETARPTARSRRPPMLVVDVGNSSTDVGLAYGTKLRHIGRMETAASTQRTLRAVIRRGLETGAPTRAVLASVVPEINGQWERAIHATCRASCLWVSPQVDIGVPITYAKPETIGADRLANACGAVARFGTPVIAADFGTALTVDVVLPGDGFVGGVIAPGLPVMLDYLSDRTAKLPRVKLARVRRAVGRSTEEAMQIGARHGYLGLVREILRELVEEIGRDDLTICATGGYAGWVVRGLNENVRRVPNLTLWGLSRIGDLNEGL